MTKLTKAQKALLETLKKRSVLKSNGERILLKEEQHLAKKLAQAKLIDIVQDGNRLWYTMAKKGKRNVISNE